MADERSSGKTVLVVEDDPSIAMGLEMNLEAEGHRVLLASDGEEALRIARAGGVDLCVLDVMLPKLNGFEVLRTLRAERITMPIIMLSARGAEMDKVMGLELGAEDYVTKPFSLAELLARVKAALRRGALGKPKQAFTFGNVNVDFDRRSVDKGGALVEMTATEFDVLACLVRSGGRVL